MTPFTPYLRICLRRRMQGATSANAGCNVGECRVQRRRMQGALHFRTNREILYTKISFPILNVLKGKGNGIGSGSVFVQPEGFDEIFSLKVFKKFNDDVLCIAFFIATDIF